MNNEIISRGRQYEIHKWLYGYHICLNEKQHYILPKNISFSDIINDLDNYKVEPDTISTCTGVLDKYSTDIFHGDIIKLLGSYTGIVTMEEGAFGIAIESNIDWYALEKAIPNITGCDNPPCFCYNDNFISLWEIMWNYNQEDDICNIIEVIGNIYDDKNLLYQT